jgi:hypothetical protein
VRTNIITDPRFEKLPKWAQDGIRSLDRERRNAITERDVAKMESGEDDSNVHLVRGLHGEDIRLPKHSGVKFFLGEGEFSYIEVRIRDGRLNVASGIGSLVIHPQVTNVINLEVASR